MRVRGTHLLFKKVLNMKSFELTVEVISEVFELKEIMTILCANGAQSSHDKGTPRGKDAIWRNTVWRSETIQASEGDVMQRLAHILGWPILKQIRENKHRLHDAQTRLDVAIFYDTVTCSIDFGEKVLAELGVNGLGLSVCCYPSLPEAGAVVESMGTQRVSPKNKD